MICLTAAKNTTVVCCVIVNEEIFESMITGQMRSGITEALAVSGFVPCNRKTSLISCKTSPVNAVIKGSYAASSNAFKWKATNCDAIYTRCD